MVAQSQAGPPVIDPFLGALDRPVGIVGQPVPCKQIDPVVQDVVNIQVVVEVEVDPGSDHIVVRVADGIVDQGRVTESDGNI